MTNLAVESVAEILVGAGGDIRTDRSYQLIVIA